MSLEVTDAAKEHVIKLGYDVAYGARPLRRVIQNMIEDVLAEHLLLGRYEPGTTIVVDKDPEAGLDIHAAESRTPVEARLTVPWRGRPDRFVCQTLRRSLPALGRPMPRVQRLEHAWSRRSFAPPRVAAPGPTPGGRLSGRSPSPRSANRTSHGRPPGSVSSIASSAVASSRVRSILLGGEPGIGKSTLLLQAAAGTGGGPVLYATGEESAAQVRLRADAPGAASTGRPATAIRGPRRARHRDGSSRSARVVRPALRGRRLDPDRDASDELDGRSRERRPGPRGDAPPDGAGQGGGDRGRARRPRDQGRVASPGPKTLEHLVDAVVTIEGERYGGLRLVRATKNRFGSTDEVGVFEMARQGLTEVADPARAFLVEHAEPAPGSVVAPDARGQPAAARRGPGPRRADRLRHARAHGQRHRPEPARPARRGPGPAGGRRARLARRVRQPRRRAGRGRAGARPARSRWPSRPRLRDRPMPAGAVAIGEVGLLGELRAVSGPRAPAARGRAPGVHRAIVPPPARGAPRVEVPGLEVIEVRDAPARRHRGGRSAAPRAPGGPSSPIPADS